MFQPFENVSCYHVKTAAFCSEFYLQSRVAVAVCNTFSNFLLPKSKSALERQLMTIHAQKSTLDNFEAIWEPWFSHPQQTAFLSDAPGFDVGCSSRIWTKNQTLFVFDKKFSHFDLFFGSLKKSLLKIWSNFKILAILGFLSDFFDRNRNSKCF